MSPSFPLIPTTMTSMSFRIGASLNLTSTRVDLSDSLTSSRLMSVSCLSIAVTGFLAGTVTFGAGEPGEMTVTSVFEGYDFFVARYDADGALEWVRHAGANADDKGLGLATLPDSSVAAVGYFHFSMTFAADEPEETVLTSAGSRDVFLAIYDGDGTLELATSAKGVFTPDEGCPRPRNPCLI